MVAKQWRWLFLPAIPWPVYRRVLALTEGAMPRRSRHSDKAAPRQAARVSDLPTRRPPLSLRAQPLSSVFGPRGSPKTVVCHGAARLFWIILPSAGTALDANLHLCDLTDACALGSRA